MFKNLKLTFPWQQPFAAFAAGDSSEYKKPDEILTDEEYNQSFPPEEDGNKEDGNKGQDYISNFKVRTLALLLTVLSSFVVIICFFIGLITGFLALLTGFQSPALNTIASSFFTFTFLAFVFCLGSVATLLFGKKD